MATGDDGRMLGGEMAVSLGGKNDFNDLGRMAICAATASWRESAGAQPTDEEGLLR
jgi:hypothetical protein